MREWQSLLHVYAGCSTELTQSFLLARLSVAACVSLSSPVLRCLVTAPLHCDRSAARFSQVSVSIPTAFMSRFTTSQYRSCGRPVRLLPVASSPYSKSFGMRPSGMRWTWPSHDPHETRPLCLGLCLATKFPGCVGGFSCGRCSGVFPVWHVSSMSRYHIVVYWWHRRLSLIQCTVLCKSNANIFCWNLRLFLAFFKFSMEVNFQRKVMLIRDAYCFQLREFSNDNSLVTKIPSVP